MKCKDCACYKNEWCSMVTDSPDPDMERDCGHHEDGYAHWCNKWEHTCPDDSEFFCKYGRKTNE